MSLLSNLAGNITGDQRATEEALAEVGGQIKALETWIQHTTNGDDTVRVIVGKEQIESDRLIFEKGLNVIIKLQDTLDIQWDNELGADLHRISIDFLVLKYVIAAGEGLKFDEKTARLYPLVAKLASLDLFTLNMYLQEAFDNTQHLYKKYFTDK